MAAYAKLEEIITERTWDMYDVRQMCLARNYYTRGDNGDYDKMLNFVNENAPTKENVYKVAEDIMKHSYVPESWCTDWLTNIMYELELKCIRTLHYVPAE